MNTRESAVAFDWQVPSCAHRGAFHAEVAHDRCVPKWAELVKASGATAE